jgi:hypothetical protein
VGEWRADQQMRRMSSDSRTRIVLTFACSNSRAVTACTHTVAPQLQMATSLYPSSVATPYLSCHLLRVIEAWPHQRAALRKPSCYELVPLGSSTPECGHGVSGQGQVTFFASYLRVVCN